jgi:hypothetical protein
MLSARFADRSSNEKKLQQWPKQREDDGDTYWLCVHPHQLLNVQNRSAVTDRCEITRTGKDKIPVPSPCNHFYIHRSIQIPPHIQPPEEAL